MTSSIFLPRMSRAWPEPSTHLTASTMFVLPEPFGPTMAVARPSNCISVCRAKVLKPSNCRDLRNKTSGQVSRCRGESPLTYQGCLIDWFAELSAADLGHRHRHDLSLDRCGGLRRLALLARRPACPGLSRRLGRRHLLDGADQAFEGRPGGVLLRLLLARAVAGAEGLRSREDDRRVLAPVAHASAFAVVDGRLAEALLSDLLQPSFEVLVPHGRRQRAIAVEVVVVRGVVPRVQEHGAQHRFETVGEQRFEVAAAPLGDAFAEVEVAAEVELLRELGQRVRVDHRGTGLGELAFGGARVVLVQVLGGDQLEDGVTEIFQSLVVTRRYRGTLISERAVRDGLEQEARVAKVNPDLLLEELQRLSERCSLRLCYEPAFSWMYSQACPTVVIFSASSSGISRPVFSSNAWMRSTRSG